MSCFHTKRALSRYIMIEYSLEGTTGSDYEKLTPFENDK